MNFTEVSKSIMLTIAAGKTPVVVGDRGIGKTQMMREIAELLDMKMINIDCNLLKEGEIGGLPIPHKNDNGVMVTQYAIHAKLKLIEDYLAENPEGSVLLFFDELNRTTRETMAELMNLILNREINGYTLPEQVFLVAAMNPSSTTNGFEGDSSYGVTEMDAASKNRLVWLYLEQDAKSWLSWATEKPLKDEAEMEEERQELDLIMFDINDYDTMIDERIVEFIASTPNMLNNPREDRDVSPSGRTWQFASDIMRTYECNKKHFSTIHLDACIKGCIGDEAYIQLMQFISNNTNPLIKPEEFWKGKELDEDLLEKFSNDTLPRQMIMAKNIARYLSEKKRLAAGDADKLATIYDLMPIDILLIIMRHIKDNHPSLNKKLLENMKYLKLYREATKLAA